MKTTILTVITAIVVVLGTANFTYATTAKNNDKGTVLNNIGQVSKIEVRGNVEVFISNDTKDQVKVYNDYYAENAMVQNDNGTLRITSYAAEKLVVYVSAYDLRTVNAYDNASIRSVGKLSYIGLDVNLYNDAYANLDLDSFTAHITAADRSKADLKGNLSEYYLNYSQSSTINRTDLIAEKTVETLSNPFQSANRHHHFAALSIISE